MNTCGHVGRKHLIVARTAQLAEARATPLTPPRDRLDALVRARKVQAAINRDVAIVCDWIIKADQDALAQKAAEMRLSDRAPMSADDRERRSLLKKDEAPA